MHKRRKPIILFVSLACFIFLIICLGLWKVKSLHSKELLYSATYYFTFGSRSVRIYNNGEVYDDLEIEDPNHKTDYKYVKTLTKEQVHELKDKENRGVSKEEISNYVIELIYGVKEFDNRGEYR